VSRRRHPLLQRRSDPAEPDALLFEPQSVPNPVVAQVVKVL